MIPGIRFYLSLMMCRHFRHVYHFFLNKRDYCTYNGLLKNQIYIVAIESFSLQTIPEDT